MPKNQISDSLEILWRAILSSGDYERIFYRIETFIYRTQQPQQVNHFNYCAYVTITSNEFFVAGHHAWKYDGEIYRSTVVNVFIIELKTLFICTHNSLKTITLTTVLILVRTSW